MFKLFTACLTVLLIGLKLSNITQYSWWVALSPLIVYISMWFLIISILVVNLYSGDKKRKVKFKKLTNSAKIPEFKSENAACMDLYADEDICLYPLIMYAISTGISMELPNMSQAKVLGRSGVTLNNSVIVPTGTIDEDYRGEIKVMMYNLGDKLFRIYKGDRIAQLDIMLRPEIEIEEVKELSETERGEGGFGSTGTN